jgi:VanZ family protein
MQPVTQFRLLGLRLAVAVLILYWFAIFVGTHLPKLPMAAQGLNDKVMHFTAFFGLATLMCYCTNSTKLVRRFGMILVLCFLYGAIDEWTQSLVRGRVTDFHDFLADASGSITAVAIYATIRWIVIQFVPSNSERKPLSSSTAD